MVANQREQKPDEWNRHALEIMLKMFPAERRPTLLHPYTDNQFNGHNVVCDRLIVGFGNLIQYNTISHLISSHLISSHLISSHLIFRQLFAIGNLQEVDHSLAQLSQPISSVLLPTDMSISSLVRNSFQVIN